MNRWIRRILICLLLGVITTVGVAWGLVLAHSVSMPLYALTLVRRPLDQPVWDFHRVTDFGTDLIEMSPKTWGSGDETPDVAANALPRWSRGRTPPTSDDVTRQVFISEVAGGWPLRSNYCTERIEPSKGRVFEALGISLHPAELPLPFAPIFPGFLVNTLIYAVVWFALLLGAGTLQRTIRRRRGRCPACAYHLRGDLATGCPECGWGRESEP